MCECMIPTCCGVTLLPHVIWVAPSRPTPRARLINRVDIAHHPIDGAVTSRRVRADPSIESYESCRFNLQPCALMEGGDWAE